MRSKLILGVVFYFMGWALLIGYTFYLVGKNVSKSKYEQEQKERKRIELILEKRCKIYNIGDVINENT